MQELLEHYFAGEATIDEKKRLFSETETNLEMKQEFIRLQNIKGLMSLSLYNTNEALSLEKLAQFYSGISWHQRRKYWLQFSRYAVAVIIAVFCTFFGLYYWNGTKEILYNEIEVPVGQRVFVTLNDGTTVWLNSRSKIRIPQTFDNNSRRVYLDGEAYFEVGKDKDKPFIVETSRYNVKVLGTKFNVINYSEMALFETTLIEGSIEVANVAKGETVILSPNEQVVLAGNQLSKRQVNNSDRTSWKNGVLVFELQPFSEIIKKLELYYNVRFIIQNTKALDVVYNGKFNATDSAEKIIDIIHQTNKFKYRVSSDRKIIYIQ
jgi:ferric-dicitrate binding protein FerR (iron transport regulator)